MFKNPYFLYGFLYLMFKNPYFLYGFWDLEEARKHGGGAGPNGNWIRRPRRGAAVLDQQQVPLLTLLTLSKTS